jgi:hypothetical protein
MWGQVAAESGFGVMRMTLTGRANLLLGATTSGAHGKTVLPVKNG